LAEYGREQEAIPAPLLFITKEPGEILKFHIFEYRFVRFLSALLELPGF
jgi:hypothetical protein